MTTQPKPHRHLFAWGKCYVCGLSRTDHVKAMKERAKERDRKRWEEKRRVA